MTQNITPGGNLRNHSFTTIYVPGTMLGAGDSVMGKAGKVSIYTYQSKERRQTVNKQTNIKKVLDSHAYYKENKTRSYDSNRMATLDWAIGKDSLDGGIGAVTW